MQNLEQQRAASALKASQAGLDYGGEKGGDIVKKLPPLILNHGLLQTLAFAETKKGYCNLCDRLALHLNERGIVPNVQTTHALIAALAAGDSQLLKSATSEALAWFNFARRFIK